MSLYNFNFFATKMLEIYVTVRSLVLLKVMKCLLSLINF